MFQWGCSQRDDPNAPAEGAIPSLEETKAIAEEAYVYGFPMILAYRVMYSNFVDKGSSNYRASFNELAHEPFATPKDPSVASPTNDTALSILEMDLRAEPVVICVPDVEEGRYYSIQLIDMYTFVYSYIGTRTTGDDEACYMIAGPDWSGETVREVRKTFRSETQFSYVAIHTQVLRPDDIPNVTKVQAGYAVQTLSSFLKQPAPRGRPSVKFPTFSDNALGTDFPAYLDFLLQFCPELPQERALRTRFARIGIGPDKKLAFKDLDQEHKAQVFLGAAEGFKKIQKRADELSKQINGWSLQSAYGDRAYYNGDYLLRAAAAVWGLYGDNAAEGLNMPATMDDKGAPLDGRQHNYTLTFPPGQLPPVNAFWSVTMYDRRTQSLVENSLNRYLVSSSMLRAMKMDADGSLTLRIQKGPVGEDKRSNWLPAPNGPFYLVMRLHWPKDKPPSILPPGSGTWAPPAVRVAD
jgi:hypothetical protein